MFDLLSITTGSLQSESLNFQSAKKNMIWRYTLCFAVKIHVSTYLKIASQTLKPSIQKI
jgi:hypothetical protein